MIHTLAQLDAGWEVLLKIGLVLLPIAIASQMWLARAVWQMLERVNQTASEIREVRKLVSKLEQRVAKLESVAIRQKDE